LKLEELETPGSHWQQKKTLRRLYSNQLTKWLILEMVGCFVFVLGEIDVNELYVGHFLFMQDIGYKAKNTGDRPSIKV
jgi:hypothetical protein